MSESIFGDEEDIFGDNPEVEVTVAVTREECIAHITSELASPRIVGRVPPSFEDGPV